MEFSRIDGFLQINAEDVYARLDEMGEDCGAWMCGDAEWLAQLLNVRGLVVDDCCVVGFHQR